MADTNEQAAVKHVVTGMKYPVRLSYAKLFQPEADDSGKLKYSTQILIDKNDTETLQKIQAAIAMAAGQKWGGNVPQGARTPLRDGDRSGPGGVPAKATSGVEPYGGHYFMNLKSDYAPDVVDQAMRKITDPGHIVSGDYARVSMNCFAFDNKNGQGLAFGLANVQLVRKGEPLGNRVAADKEFEAIPTDPNAVAAGDMSGQAPVVAPAPASAVDPTRPFG